MNILSLVVFIVSLGLGSSLHAQEISYKGLIISEIKVRYESSSGLDIDEFVELHNDSLSPADLRRFAIEYFNTTSPESTQQPTQSALLEPKILAAGSKLILARQPAQIDDSLQLPFSSLADTGGRLRLVSTEGDIVDEIAWTNVQSAAMQSPTLPILYQCNSSSSACVANRTQSHSRIINEDGIYTILTPFWQLSAPSPQSVELSAPVEEIPDDPEPPNPDLGDDEELVIPSKTCEGIVISELLPNPRGADAGHEFIELYNPTNEVISLVGCSLQTSASNKKYNFESLQLSPNAYVAFYNDVTTLTLANNAGGTVWLLSPTDEIHLVTYPSALGEDVAWASVEQIWTMTYAPTPNTVNNIILQKPCEDGEVRDEISSECRKPAKTVIDSLAPCRTGQVRNPETNRCRAVAAAHLVSLVSCKSGQERNPETNRCRNIVSAKSLVACPEGEERNKSTNRCRKSVDASGATLASVTDQVSPVSSFGPGWWVVGGVALLAIGYAIFEWRQDIRQLLSRASPKLKR